ncbi:reverse transcriptase domain-containing protein [Priestia aryabhattai]|uniref:reverse transcriptase domain-containing protein n=1 Tax=Priestia aryabhattai TaxID=412384 RepID=UPI0018737C57|nr:reverse transcriptase domain-containing protein [Priestia aryabhattai]MBE5101483.1 group II intron reverse transcriptase/maturase [Priestia aryabhattai]
MRSPSSVLNSLASKSENSTYTYKRLYRNLYNPEFYYIAYQKIYAKQGNMTQGVDGKTIDGMSLKRIDDLIEALKTESYQPKPVKRVYIPKKNGKRRPLGIPSMDDKLIQEVVRMILESIYEGTFSKSSHGFRPNRSCHTALMEIKKLFDGTRWFIEGDIESFFDNINHHKLISILRRRIQDEKFINLIWKFLRTGYLEVWEYHKTYSGSPQGGIISPILANIYLNEFDKHVEQIITKFNKGTRRKLNPTYSKINKKLTKLRKVLQEEELSEDKQRDIILTIKELREERSHTPVVKPHDEDFKRMYYTRYADDFLIGMIGDKQEALQVKQKLAEFLKDDLQLNLSQEKTLITHSSKPARFLGYDVMISRNQDRKMCKDGRMRRTKSYTCTLNVPHEKWVDKLKDLRVLKITPNGTWKPVHRTSLIHLDDLEILQIYNAQIRGMYNYYKLAKNVSVLNKFYYHMKYSLYKTFANKYKTSINKITNKYCENGVFTVTYSTKKGVQKSMLYSEGFTCNTKIKANESYDLLVNEQKNKGETSLIDRLKATTCEWCGKTNIPLEMHHIRRIKDLKGKAKWEKWMIGRRRKTVALCHECHRDLHNGKLD